MSAVQQNKVVQFIITQECSRCEKTKPLSEFGKGDKNKNNGRAYACKECISKSSKERREKLKAAGLLVVDKEAQNLRYKKHIEKIKSDPDKLQSQRKKWNEAKKRYWATDKYLNSNYMQKYGVGLEEVVRALDDQHGLCANHACGKMISIRAKNGGEKAVIDHDHKTGKFRAVLCHHCNTLAGQVENNLNKIFGIMDYLKKFN